MAAERRTLWLGAMLIAAIIAAIVVRSMDGTTTRTTRGPSAPRAQANGRASAAAGQAADTPVVVNLHALAQDRGQPADEGRNPFRFRPKPAPAVAPSAAPPVNQAPPAPIVPAGPPPPPPIPLKFIGIVQKLDGTKIAVLSDGRRPYYGVEGQEIDGQYKILKIGVESIEISYLDGRGLRTIRLDGGAKD